MSYLKFSKNAFLDKEELDKFKTFLDDDGFRNFLVQNSSTFGWIKKPNAAFTNGLVTQGAGLTVDIAAATLINSDGNLISSEAVEALAITADSLWYWIKIVYAASSKEIGTYSIDASGNLTCTSGDGSFNTLLRGQPNYPSRVKFLNASLNTLEYDVEEVLSNNSAVLTGTFVAEEDLTLSVVGTFTSGYSPPTADKNLFQYDSATISLVQSTTTTPPAHTTGLEFFIARVKNTGAAISIEDKRDEFWTTNSAYLLKTLDITANPLIGIEQITFDDPLTPRDKNVLQIAWGFRGTTFTTDLKNNKVTISAGSGGKFKAATFSADFDNGDFDGWRCYTEDGEYFTIQTSVVNGSTIELNFDYIEATSFFSDIDSSVAIAQTLIIVPEAEEIEIICTPSADESDLTQDNLITSERQIFPINELYGRMRLIVWHATAAQYTITYRYKQVLNYSPEAVIPDDAVGYYNENQFNSNGYRTGSTQTPYSSGLITLIQVANAFSNVVGNDVIGVRTIALTNATPVLTLEVGVDKQYQRFSGDALTLSADMYINIEEGTRDGNFFLFHFLQSVDLNGFVLRLVTNYVSAASYDLIFVVTQELLDFVKVTTVGSFTRLTWDESAWIVATSNQFSTDWVLVPTATYIKYRRDGFGFVQVIGVIGTQGDANNLTLPVGCRPDSTETFYCMWGDDANGGTVNIGMDTITVSAAGVINSSVITGAGTDRNTYFNFSFRASQ